MATKNTASSEARVTVKVPRKYNGDNVLAIQINGGKIYQIKRGESVEVPADVAEVANQIVEEEERVYRMLEKARAL